MTLEITFDDTQEALDIALVDLFWQRLQLKVKAAAFQKFQYFDPNPIQLIWKELDVRGREAKPTVAQIMVKMSHKVE